MDAGPEAVPDSEETRLLRAQAIRVYTASFAGALLLTALGVLVAGLWE